ncbi:MAG: hypothetical protein ACR2PX_00280 [Endozoicomonas sp.]
MKPAIEKDLIAMSRNHVLSLLLGMMLSQSIVAADFHLVTENFPPSEHDQ